MPQRDGLVRKNDVTYGCVVRRTEGKGVRREFLSSYEFRSVPMSSPVSQAATDVLRLVAAANRSSSTSIPKPGPVGTVRVLSSVLRWNAVAMS